MLTQHTVPWHETFGVEMILKETFVVTFIIHQKSQ